MLRACCSGEFSEFGVHAKALEGLGSLHTTTYHLLRNLTCRDCLFVRGCACAHARIQVMMPQKILARGPRVLADSQLAGQEAIRDRDDFSASRGVLRTVGLSGPQTVQDQLH